MPLTVDQAIANASVTKEVQIAYAEEDRSTLSPFDASSKNTFLGSMVHNLLPFYGQLNSVSGVLKTVGNIPFVSLSSLLKPSSAGAADTAAQFSLCDDPAIKDKGIAAGPFCSVEYGIPSEYLDLDPQSVVEQLIASGDIDENTGEPLDKESSGDETASSLKNWMEICTDGSTDQLASCKIDKSNDPAGAKLVSLYAIYTIDHRIQMAMDGEDPELSDESNEEVSTIKTVFNTVAIVPDTHQAVQDSTELLRRQNTLLTGRLYSVGYGVA